MQFAVRLIPNCPNVQGDISMNIYPSTQVRPYVYFGIDSVTGEFYIGYREANSTPSHIDLFKYRTSSKIVNPKFDQFNWVVAAEFFTGDDAYDFEQQLIFENWNNPLLLNRHCFYGKNRFKSAKGRKHIIIKKRGPHSEETKAKNAESHRGKIQSVESNTARSEKLIGRIPWNKGVPMSTVDKEVRAEKVICPHCNKVGGKSAMKRYHFNNCKSKAIL